MLAKYGQFKKFKGFCANMINNENKIQSHAVNIGKFMQNFVSKHYVDGIKE